MILQSIAKSKMLLIACYEMLINTIASLIKLRDFADKIMLRESFKKVTGTQCKDSFVLSIDSSASTDDTFTI